MRKNLVLWPRVEQRKWILAKKQKQKQKQKHNHQKNKSTGRITRRNKKNKKKTRTQQTKKQNLHFPQFFSCFFLGFGFLVCFFCLLCFFFAFLFFCQTLYSLRCWTHKSSEHLCKRRHTTTQPITFGPQPDELADANFNWHRYTLVASHLQTINLLIYASLPSGN